MVPGIPLILLGIFARPTSNLVNQELFISYQKDKLHQEEEGTVLSEPVHSADETFLAAVLAPAVVIYAANQWNLGITASWWSTVVVRHRVAAHPGQLGH